jgi:hypothetical protein
VVEKSLLFEQFEAQTSVRLQALDDAVAEDRGRRPEAAGDLLLGDIAAAWPSILAVEP